MPRFSEWSRFVPILWLAFVFAAEAQPFKGDCADSVLLGSEGWPELKRTMRAVRDQVKAGEAEAAIALQRDVVRLQCHNHYQRYYLAELMVRVSDFEGAVHELRQLDELRVNDLETRLENPKNALHPVLASSAFAGSDLERRISERKKARAIRHERFQRRLAALDSDARPPDPYVATNVCPFECCRFGRWSVLEDSIVYDAKGSAEQIAVAKAGTHLDGLTGDVLLQPIPVVIVHPVDVFDPPATFRPGEIVFLLDSMGEGFRHVWHAGVVRTVESSGTVRAACAFPGKDCWGEYLAPVGEQGDYVWWVRVRLDDGTVGWARSDGFGDIGGCG